MTVLEVNNLKKGFGATDVLKGVSFTLEQGQVLAIIGSSGSGKTTLLRCLNFLETPDAGEIAVEGKCLTGTHLSEDPVDFPKTQIKFSFQMTINQSAKKNSSLRGGIAPRGNPVELRDGKLVLTSIHGIATGRWPSQ